MFSLRIFNLIFYSLIAFTMLVYFIHPQQRSTKLSWAWKVLTYGRCQLMTGGSMFCPSGLLISPGAVFKVIANAEERFQSDICHGALLVYTEKAYCASTEPNTKVLPNYFRISFYSAMCLSSKPVHCTQWDVSWGSIPRGATGWLVQEPRWTGGEHYGAGLWWFPSWALLTASGWL